MRQSRWSIHTSLAAITTGLLASVCCIGPLLLAVLGIGGAGLLVKFEPYRPYFMGFTLLLLGTGFYFAYFRKAVTSEATTDDCGCEQPKKRQWGKVMLWVATVVTIVAMASPYILATFSSGSFSTASASKTQKDVRQITIKIKGMTCGGCVANVKRELAKVKGILSAKVTFNPQQATIKYHPKQASPKDFLRAIRKAGYKVTTSQATTSKSKRQKQLAHLPPALPNLKQAFNRDKKYVRLLFMFSPV